jgi:hypothetical protein
MEFFLERTLPEFNQAGTRLDWSWSKSFLEFENVLGDGYRTTWLKVLTDHFPGPLTKEPKAIHELKRHDKKENFYHAMPFSYVRYLGMRNLATGNASTCSREVTLLFKRI